MKIAVLERNSAGVDIEMDYSDLGEVTYYPNTVTKEEVAERIKDADVVVANKSPFCEETLRDAKNLKLICELATGYDNCDLAYCKERGIQVCNVVDYSTAMVAQHTFTLALSLLGKLPHYDNYVKSGAYGAQDRFSNFDIPFYELDGKVWGIVGMGNIGRRVAKIAEAFGCKVIFYSASGNSTCTEYERVDLDTLLERSDVLSLHCPLTDRTRYLIDEKALNKMKPSAVLVNVARGAVFDNKALYEALLNKKFAAAGLDVLEQEPISEENPLRLLKDSNQLIITPHLAWASVEARTRCVAEVRRNIESFMRGEIRNVVNP